MTLRASVAMIAVVVCTDLNLVAGTLRRAPHGYAQISPNGTSRNGSIKMPVIRRLGFGAGHLQNVTSIEHTRPSGRLAIWIAGFPRSGTSSILSSISAGDHPCGSDCTHSGFEWDAHGYSQMPGRIFSLFEPCHEDDDLGSISCAMFLQNLCHCDFSGVRNLFKWADPHTTSNHTVFDTQIAGRLCNQAEVVAFKTISVAHRLDGWWLANMKKVPSMLFVDVVRDPRAIYGSWKRTEYFKEHVKSKNKEYSMSTICQNFFYNLNVSHERMYRLKFESLVKRPHLEIFKLRKFLGLPNRKEQSEWVTRTFNAVKCPQQPDWFVGFDDCHTNSRVPLDSWRASLSKEEMDEFSHNHHCIEVAKAYKYPLN
eukprot:TRINITY_DN76027_c0_g1_i1.p1 TRINITY_DN76027_c0_g1~~TRINITY_DN76027_c0_g1_i1.p1  ORF type:complete len:368 (-),score=29.08 TRINITY_DN76027_c0_g1_i1:75-1178(-)